MPKSIGSEPYKKRTSHGMILGEGGVKMSKSKGNVINPDEIIKEYGADTLRVYEMFIGPFQQMIPWDTKGVKGIKKFLEKVWRLKDKVSSESRKSEKLISIINKTIKKVDQDIEQMKFNTAVASLMVLVNEFEQQQTISLKDYITFLTILNPFAPFLTEEIFEQLKISKMCYNQKWPKYNSKLIEEKIIDLIVQINGKVRDKIEVKIGISEEEAKEIVLKQDKIKKWIDDKKIKKIIFVPGKIINFVI
ncbi:MAG: class I tRNA ligase family protein [Candidatus Nealsonbacteria bacterium]